MSQNYSSWSPLGNQCLTREFSQNQVTLLLHKKYFERPGVVKILCIFIFVITLMEVLAEGRHCLATSQHPGVCIPLPPISACGSLWFGAQEAEADRSPCQRHPSSLRQRHIHDQHQGSRSAGTALL